MNKIFVVLISIFLVQACATRQKNETRSVSSQNQAEFEMQTEIVEMNPEVFENVENKFKLREMLKKIRSIKNNLIDSSGSAIEHVAVGISAEAFVGVGASKMIELAVHDKKIGVFCAPGVSVRTDVGVELAVSYGKTLSCDSNEHYSGGFLGAFGGVSAEAAGLPLAGGASYNVGVNYSKLKESLDDALDSKKLSLTKLSQELRFTTEHAESAGMLLLYSMAYQLIANRNNASARAANRINALLARLARGNRSLSRELLSFLNSHELNDFLRVNKLNQLGALSSILKNSLTGCDSVGGALGLSLSVSPASVGIKYSDFALLTEFDLDELKELNVLSPEIFDNPFEYSVSQLRTTVSLAGKLLAIPFQLQNDRCQVTHIFKVQ